MALRINFRDGHSVDYNHVRYVSTYPNVFEDKDGLLDTPMMRIEFADSIYPSMTIELWRIENFTLIAV